MRTIKRLVPAAKYQFNTIKICVFETIETRKACFAELLKATTTRFSIRKFKKASEIAINILIEARV